MESERFVHKKNSPRFDPERACNSPLVAQQRQWSRGELTPFQQFPVVRTISSPCGAGRSSWSLRGLYLSSSLCTFQKCTSGLAQDYPRLYVRASLNSSGQRAFLPESPPSCFVLQEASTIMCSDLMSHWQRPGATALTAANPICFLLIDPTARISEPQPAGLVEV